MLQKRPYFMFNFFKKVCLQNEYCRNFFIFHFYNTLFLSLFAIFYYLNLVNEI